jgi:hypothetical protein
MINGNPFAMAGCTNPDVAGFDWPSLWYTVAVLNLWWGLVLWLSPFEIFPITGKWKFAFLNWNAAVKEDAIGGRSYDIWSAAQAQFAGVGLIILGLVSIWATEERSGWTFMTVACVGWALALATFIRVLVANFASWNWLVYIWGVMFTVGLVLSYLILADQESDAEQLSKTAAKDGLNAGAVFWFFAIFSFASGAQLVLTTFKFAEKYGGAFFMKGAEAAHYEPSGMAKSIQRLNGTFQFQLGLIFLWAAVNYDADGEPELTLPLVGFISFLFLVIQSAGHFIAMEDFWENFAVVHMCLMTSGFATSYLIGWAITCH